MLTRDEQDLAKSLGREMPRLGYDLGLIEGDAENRIVP